jgi:uncharacterized protein YihD (DUF1040 family)
MAASRVNSQINLSALAKMMSNAGLQRILFSDNFKQNARHLKRLLQKNGVEVEKKTFFSELIDISYEHLLANYRHEYLYKVALLNSYVLQHHSLADTILLNEFRIGNSKADAVLVNGTNKVFEIKTELDSPERLSTQIDDYYKAFSEVYIVIHHSQVGKYLPAVGEQVGIMIFTDRNEIELLKPALAYEQKLEILSMMKALRKEEYIRLVYGVTGEIPNTTPVQMFKECAKFLSVFPVLDVQREFLNIIKQRICHSTNELVQNATVPAALRLPCYNYNLDNNDYLGLVEKLNYQI